MIHPGPLDKDILPAAEDVWRLPKIFKEKYEYFRLYFRRYIHMWMKYTFTVSRYESFSERNSSPLYLKAH